MATDDPADRPDGPADAATPTPDRPAERARLPRRQRGPRLAASRRGRVWALLTIIAGAVLGWVLPTVSEHLPSAGLSYQSSTAEAALAAIAGAMITLAGFVVTAIMLVLQTVQSMSPRLIGALGELGRHLFVFALLIGTALYALVALSQIHAERTSHLAVTLAVVLVLVNSAAVLFLLGSLRNAATGGGLSRDVGARLRHVVDTIYATPVDAEPPRARPEPGPAPDGDPVTLRHTGRPGVLQSFDEPGLVALAARHGVRVELTVGVGDFVEAGGVYGRLVRTAGARPGDARPGDARPGDAHSGAAPFRAVPDDLGGLADRIAAAVSFGPTRTIEQDAAYGLRLLSDIAIRALSPAVNDPTTAVQALDQIEDVLVILAGRALGPAALLGADGAVRVRCPAPDWDDLVALALDEVLLYGASSPQVARRCVVLLDRVGAAAPPARRAPVTEHRALLARLAAAALPDPYFVGLAGTPDVQGLGGGARPDAP